MNEALSKVPVNWALLANPVNWAIVLLMLAFAGVALAFVIPFNPDKSGE